MQQIADIQDGALPLQEALDTNIQALQAEIGKLNGSLALCRQLKDENARILDTERYWGIIQEKEQQGFKFHSFLKDYMSFMEPVVDWYLLHVPNGEDRSLKKILKYSLYWALGFAAFDTLLTGDFTGSLLDNLGTVFIGWPITFLGWCILFLPVYFIRKKYPKLANILWVLFPTVVLLGVIFLFTWLVFKPITT